MKRISRSEVRGQRPSGQGHTHFFRHKDGLQPSAGASLSDSPHPESPVRPRLPLTFAAGAAYPRLTYKRHFSRQLSSQFIHYMWSLYSSLTPCNPSFRPHLHKRPVATTLDAFTHDGAFLPPWAPPQTNSREPYWLGFQGHGIKGQGHMSDEWVNMTAEVWGWVWLVLFCSRVLS